MKNSTSTRSHLCSCSSTSRGNERPPLAQKGPSVTSTSTVESVRLVTANRALSARAPITSRPEAARKAGSGTARLPHVAPQRFTAQSEGTPPTGMPIRVHTQDRVVSHAARSRLKCRTCTR